MEKKWWGRFLLEGLELDLLWSESEIVYSVMSNSLQPHGLYSSLGSSVHGILLARVLEWVAMPFSRGSSPPWDRTQVSHTAGRFFTV